MCVFKGMGNNLAAFKPIETVPYTDVTAYPPFDFNTVNHQLFSLGFIIADNDKEPSWGGYHKVNSNFLKDEIRQIRSKGGDIIISFGGQQGTELAEVVSNYNVLYNMYRDIVIQYNLKWIDFDIEGRGVSNSSANILRSLCIVALKKEFPKLKVSLTVPVEVNGLDDKALLLVKSTPCDLLNIMTMDFGHEKNMGAACISALKATRKQTGMDLAVTPMIGENDTGEIFTLHDARTLKQFVDQNAYVKRISYWAIERDNGLGLSLDNSSMVEQEKFAFLKIFKQ